jgi:hypothetical protein
MMATPELRNLDFDWNALNLQIFDLSHLDAPFTEEEVLAAINHTAPVKASGPDGFTGAFFRSCWSIIKGDLMAMFYTLHSLRSLNFDLLNTANIILLPKKVGAEKLSIIGRSASFIVSRNF